MPLAGAAVGAAEGALGGALVDVGINDQDMKQEANEALKPGTAGLFLLIRKMTTDKVLEDLKGAGGTVIRSSFDHAKENALRAALFSPMFPYQSLLHLRSSPPQHHRQLQADCEANSELAGGRACSVKRARRMTPSSERLSAR